MPVAALIDPNTGNVVNTIIADASIEQAPAGYLLVAVPDGQGVDSRWVWSQADGFRPGAALQAELDAAAASPPRGRS